MNWWRVRVELNSVETPQDPLVARFTAKTIVKLLTLGSCVGLVSASDPTVTSPYD